MRWMFVVAAVMISSPAFAGTADPATTPPPPMPKAALHTQGIPVERNTAGASRQAFSASAHDSRMTSRASYTARTATKSAPSVGINRSSRY